MSKFEEKVALYKQTMEESGLECDENLLIAITRSLGPSIYNADAEKVSASDPEEIARVKNNFLIGKLGLGEDDGLDEGITSALNDIPPRRRYRAIVYYRLVTLYNQEDKFL